MHLNSSIAALLAGLNNPSLPGIDLSLERMVQLLAALGNPQEKLPPVIHFAGTNGKGSTLAFLRAIYTATGARVHAYTSPHLVRFNERITLAGHEISDDALLALLPRIARVAQSIPVTFFEATTAAAFLSFAETPADMLLLETGLGGRLDATNVVAHPALTIITPINYDHTEFLGDSLTAIAREKAGILKPGVPCITGAQPAEALDVLRTIAAQIGAPLMVHGEDWHFEKTTETLHLTTAEETWEIPLPPLLGPHQYHNAALAAAAARTLGIALPAIARGIAAAHWPARLQPLSHGPLVDAWGNRGRVILDGAHNASAASAVADWIATTGTPVTLICGMMRRKDASAFFAPLAAHIRRAITVPIPGEDCYAPAVLAEHARASGIANVTACDRLADTSAHLATDAPGTLLIAGSLFLAGELLKNHG